jgi:hypothetical protein
LDPFNLAVHRNGDHHCVHLAKGNICQKCVQSKSCHPNVKPPKSTTGRKQKTGVYERGDLVSLDI